LQEKIVHKPWKEIAVKTGFPLAAHPKAFLRFHARDMDSLQGLAAGEQRQERFVGLSEASVSDFNT
jgi:hypothetical protein